MNRLTSEQANNLLSPGAAAAGAAVFLVGIGGCGMSALGHLLLDLGFRVIGSDQAGNEDLDRLRARGVEIQVGPHRAETLIAVRPILVAYSSQKAER